MPVQLPSTSPTQQALVPLNLNILVLLIEINSK